MWVGWRGGLYRTIVITYLVLSGTVHGPGNDDIQVVFIPSCCITGVQIGCGNARDGFLNILLPPYCVARVIGNYFWSCSCWC